MLKHFTGFKHVGFTADDCCELLRKASEFTHLVKDKTLEAYKDGWVSETEHVKFLVLLKSINYGLESWQRLSIIFRENIKYHSNKDLGKE